MAQEGRRVEVRMGSFACTIEGYDDPISKLKEVMALVQQMVSETPALVDLSLDVDNAEVQEALDARPEPVTVRNDAPEGQAEPDAGTGSETDGDFTLAAEAPTGERPDWLAGPEELDVERAADFGPDDAPAPDAPAMDDPAGAADPFSVDETAGAGLLLRTSDEDRAPSDAASEAPLRLHKTPSDDAGDDEAPLRRTPPDDVEGDAEPLRLRPTPSDGAADEDAPLRLRRTPDEDTDAGETPTRLRWTPSDSTEDDDTAEPAEAEAEEPAEAEAGEPAEAEAEEPATPSDPGTTPAGRHLYGMGRFAAGMVGRQRTAETESDAPAGAEEDATEPDAGARTPEKPRPILVDTDDAVNIFAASPEDDFEATVVADPEEEAPVRPRVSTGITNIFASARPEKPAEATAEEPAEKPAEPRVTTRITNIFGSAPPEEPGTASTADNDDDLAEPGDEADASNIFAAAPQDEPGAPATGTAADAGARPWESTAAGNTGDAAPPSGPETAAIEEPEEVPVESRISTGFRNIFTSRSRAAEPAGDASEQNIFAADAPREPAPAVPPAAPFAGPARDDTSKTAEAAPDTGNDAPAGDGGAEATNLFATADDDAEDDPFRPVEPQEPDTADEKAPLQLTPEARVDDDAGEQIAPRPQDTGPRTEPTSRSGRFGALLERIQARDGTGPAPGEGGPVAPAAANVTAAELVERSGAENVSDLLLASAAWLTLAGGKPQFSRRDVMEVFESLPGDHPRTLEARIKGYGKLVRSGALVLINDGQFAVARSERERFESLVT